jgi:glycosyltransferase involved in cell wall biosynthesis
MKDAIVELGVNADKIIVEGDGVLLRRFISPENAQLIKDKYALPMDRKILGYVGSLITRNTIEKGIFEMLEAISFLRKQNLPVCGFIVGGPKSWKLRYMKIARSLKLTDKDIIFYDRVSSGQIASILHACDLLVYPAPKSSHPYFIRDTSPLKLFEYLASGKPIVCADILPIRDVVNEESVSLVPSGDSIAMASAIKKNLFETMSDTNEKKNKRLQLAQWYDWHSRMERILSRARQ